MSLSPQWLDELRARVSLSGVISRTTRLTKAGHEFKACCPFHNEKSPSFTVNDQKGFYHCFGCGAHGDAIRWMTDQRGLSFMDAVKELAAEAGMEVPAPDPRAAEAAQQRDSLHDVMAAAQAWFVERLASPEGEKARAYLATRGFNERTIERFGFGYAPEGRQAMKEALKAFPEAMLIEGGLRIKVDEKDPYDRFRGRLMLPIEDARGRVIAFGGRILDKDKTDAPKYLNSPDTPLFDKGRTLYNLHRAGPLSRQSGRLIVVEGYMDVIALSAAGIGECVAPLGTALTELQLQMLWRLVDASILCFDGDAAGQRAAMRAAERALPLLQPGKSLKIVTLPVGMDPDDIVKRAGAKGMEVLLEEPHSLSEYIWLHELKAFPLDTPEAKADLKARLLNHAEKIQNSVIRSLYRDEFNSRYSAFMFGDRSKSKTKVKTEIEDGRIRKRKWLAKIESEVYDNYMHDRLGAAIAEGFLNYPEEIYRYAETLSAMKRLDSRIDVMLDELEYRKGVDRSLFLVAFAQRDVSKPEPKDFDELHFPFAWSFFSPEVAIPSLRRAVRLYTQFQSAREQFEHAKMLYQKNFDRDSELEHDRMRIVVDSLFRDLKELVTQN